MEILKKIGFTDGEIKVYLTLLKLKSSTTGPLTNKSGVSRSKVYEILDKLMQKGLVSYIIKDKNRYYQAVEPNKIKEYLDEKENEFLLQKKEFDKALPELEMLGKETSSENCAEIFNGFKSIKTIHENMLRKLRKGEEFFYFGISSLNDIKYQTYWEIFHKKRETKKIKCKLLFNKDTNRSILKNRNKFRLCDARYMPLDIKTPSWIMGYNNIIVIGVLGDDEIAIQIENKKIAKSFREYFDSFWELSKSFT